MILFDEKESVLLATNSDCTVSLVTKPKECVGCHAMHCFWVYRPLVLDRKKGFHMLCVDCDTKEESRGQARAP